MHDGGRLDLLDAVGRHDGDLPAGMEARILARGTESLQTRRWRRESPANSSLETLILSSKKRERVPKTR